jgi:hypothetical protein
MSPEPDSPAADVILCSLCANIAQACALNPAQPVDEVWYSVPRRVCGGCGDSSVCSGLSLSAVDEEFGSGDEACVRGSEEDGGAGDVIGITDTP